MRRRSTGRRKTLYNRFVRWSEKGVLTGIFDTLSQTGGPVLEVMIESTAVRAHRVAHSGKGGLKPTPWAELVVVREQNSMP